MSQKKGNPSHRIVITINTLSFFHSLYACVHAFTINVIFLANSLATSVVKSCQKLCMYIHKDAMYVGSLGNLSVLVSFLWRLELYWLFFPFIGQYDYVYTKNTHTCGAKKNSYNEPCTYIESNLF